VLWLAVSVQNTDGFFPLINGLTDWLTVISWLAQQLIHA